MAAWKSKVIQRIVKIIKTDMTNITDKKTNCCSHVYMYSLYNTQLQHSLNNLII